MPLFALAAMQSSHYSITIDSINFAGNYSTSTSYRNQDTLGEVATGNSSSTNYAMNAGYQQMYTSFISMSAIGSTSLPAMSGIATGVSTSTIPATVITDNPAGYFLTLQATSSPALKSASGASFADYVPTATPSPDFVFTVGSGASAFGFSVLSTDASTRYLNNGSSCNTGSSNTAFACWDGLSTTAAVIAQSSGANYPAGTLTTVGIEAKVGTAKIQDSGTYSATVILTATTL